jgi:hypothetical protein
MLEPPYVVGGIALWWGYLRAALKRVPTIADHDLMAALRREQLTRLWHQNRIPEVELDPEQVPVRPERVRRKRKTGVG